MKYNKSHSVTVRLTQEELEKVDFLINPLLNSRSEVIRHLIHEKEWGIKI